MQNSKQHNVLRLRSALTSWLVDSKAMEIHGTKLHLDFVMSGPTVQQLDSRGVPLHEAEVHESYLSPGMLGADPINSDGLGSMNSEHINFLAGEMRSRLRESLPVLQRIWYRCAHSRAIFTTIHPR